ncbi:MAG TPA: ABC transporter permease [Dehalococcoidales bacterium]|nr:ABC transporter permease [Dehalococcoidales bacterium]
MNKTLLLIKHEFLGTVRRKAFIILTIAFPLIALLGILAGQVLPGMIKTTTTIEKVGYVDQVGLFTQNTSESNIHLIPYSTEDAAKTALEQKDISEYFVIPANYIKTGSIQRYTLTTEIAPGSAVQSAISDFMLNNLLQGNSPDIIARAKNPVNISSTTLTAAGTPATNQGGFSAIILPYIFSILLLLAIFTSSGYLLQGLGEEKENRVMEILLSSISPRQLLAGKVLGLGAAGLVQIVVWLISANFLLRMASASWGNVLGSLQITPEFLILGIVYFILGYLLMAILMAGVGSISPTAREGQQMSVIFIMPVIIPIYFITLIMENSDSIAVRILTFIPLTAPITVMVRSGISVIPIWELIVSIGILILSVWGLFILTTKLFRTYLLMYGKRPDMKEIVRSFRAS